MVLDIFQMKSIAIIGGGISGIVALREMTLGGHHVVLFEEAAALGGVWVPDGGDAARAPQGRVYDSLTTNSSRAVSTLSDVPIDGFSERIYPSYKELQRYYHHIAEVSGLLPRIRLQTKVTALRQEVGSEKWLVQTSHGNECEKFDIIIVATGTFGQTNGTDIPWTKKFRGGPVIHSSKYRNIATLGPTSTVRHVAVIGIGNSALDISFSIASSSAKVTVCSSGALMIPVWSDTLEQPADYHLLSRDFDNVHGSKKAKAFESYSLEATKIFVGHGMPFNRDRMSILKNHKEYYDHLAAGRITMAHNVMDIQPDGRTLVCTDGQVIPNVDAVVLCTGYRIRYPFLEDPPMSKDPLFPGKSDGFHQDYAELYKFVVDPNRPTLFFVGVFDTHGNSGVLSEMQARWIRGVLAGAVTLPGLDERRRWVAEQKNRDIKKSYGKMNPMYRGYVATMDLYARDLGVMPSPSLWPVDKPMLGALYRRENWTEERLRVLQSKL